MSSNEKISANVRTKFGKGAARRLRAAGSIPAVMYGHGTDPLHLELPGHAMMLAVRTANAVLTFDVDGEDHLALVKDVQRDPVLRIIEHIDLVVVKKGERVEVEVAIQVVGEPAPGTIALQDLNTVLVSAEATHIPDGFELDVEGLEEGTVKTVQDLNLPKGVSLVDEEAEDVIVSVQVPRGEEEGESEEGEEGEENAESGDSEDSE